MRRNLLPAVLCLCCALVCTLFAWCGGSALGWYVNGNVCCAAALVLLVAAPRG